MTYPDDTSTEILLEDLRDLEDQGVRLQEALDDTYEEIGYLEAVIRQRAKADAND